MISKAAARRRWRGGGEKLDRPSLRGAAGGAKSSKSEKRKCAHRKLVPEMKSCHATLNLNIEKRAAPQQY